MLWQIANVWVFFEGYKNFVVFMVRKGTTQYLLMKISNIASFNILLAKTMIIYHE